MKWSKQNIWRTVTLAATTLFLLSYNNCSGTKFDIIRQSQPESQDRGTTGGNPVTPLQMKGFTAPSPSFASRGCLSSIEIVDASFGSILFPQSPRVIDFSSAGFTLPSINLPPPPYSGFYAKVLLHFTNVCGTSSIEVTNSSGNFSTTDPSRMEFRNISVVDPGVPWQMEMQIFADVLETVSAGSEISGRLAVEWGPY